MGYRELADEEADRIENDEALTDEEKRRYLRELGDELAELEREGQY